MHTETCQSYDAFLNWQPEVVKKLGDWGYNFDLEVVWDQVGGVGREAVGRKGGGPGDVAGIAVASMRLAMVVIDRHGEFLFLSTN